MTTQEQELFQNRAELDRTPDSDPQTKDVSRCEYCNETLVFAMRDRYHKFSLPLGTALECLRIAENEGYLPKIPSDWWRAVLGGRCMN